MNFDLEAIKRKMLVKYPFFASIVANAKYKEENSINTAATDGETIYYNVNFMSSLSVDEQIFVMAHEVCHIAFNHIKRLEGRHPKAWNIATDAVINAFLKKDGLKAIDGAIDISEAIEYDAEELYKKLFNDLKQQENQEPPEAQNQNAGANQEEKNRRKQKTPNGNEGKEQQGQGEFEDVGHDTHSMWGKAIQKSKEAQGEKSDASKEVTSEEQKDEENGIHNIWKKIMQKRKKTAHEQPEKKNKEKQDETRTQSEDSEIEKKQKECEQLGEKDAFKKNNEVKKKELEDLKKELYKQSSEAGTETNEDTITVTNVGTAKPLIDWRYILTKTINYNIDWSFRNSTIENGILRPSIEEIPVPEAEIVLDTSGSINIEMLKNFLRECLHILKHAKIKVGCFDTKFYGFQEIRTEKDIENMQFQGGGGTDFNAAVNAFTRRAENKIIFTDGYASMPEKEIKAIWIVFGAAKIKPKGGTVIQIDDNQLTRLCAIAKDNKTRGKSH